MVNNFKNCLPRPVRLSTKANRGAGKDGTDMGITEILVSPPPGGAVECSETFPTIGMEIGKTGENKKMTRTKQTELT